MPDIAECKTVALPRSSSILVNVGSTASAWNIVGRIVEVVSDQSLEVYFRENIFAPLDMANIGFLADNCQTSQPSVAAGLLRGWLGELRHIVARTHRESRACRVTVA